MKTPEEKAREHGVPVIPKLPEYTQKPYDPNPVVAICGECGREIRKIEGYSCLEARCPVQPKFR